MATHSVEFVRDRIVKAFAQNGAAPVISIYEGSPSMPDADNPFDTWAELDQKETLERLKYMEDNCYGKYTFFIRHKKTDALKGAMRLTTVIGGDDQPMIGRGGGNMNMASMERMISAEVERRMAGKKIEFEMMDLRRELKEFKEGEAQWGMMAQQLMSTLILKQAPAAAINGPAAAAPAATHPVINAGNMNALEASFNTILEQIGEENVYKMAMVCVEKPALRDQFKQLLASMPITNTTD